MKKPRRIPEGNSPTNSPRCAVCGEQRPLRVMPTGKKWCDDCVDEFNMKLIQPPNTGPSMEPSHYHGVVPGGGWMPADGRTVTRQEYPNAFLPDTGRLSLGQEATILYDMLAKALAQQRQMLDSLITRIAQLEGRIEGQNAIIHEQTETIKDLIEELSE